MKSVLQKILSLLMALLVLLSTVSFTVNEHFCGDKLVSKSVYIKADDCGMEIMKTNEDTEACKVVKPNCCTEKQTLVKEQENIKDSAIAITKFQANLLTCFAYSYKALFTEVSKKATSFAHYQSPLVVKQLFKLDQVFLI